MGNRQATNAVQHSQPNGAGDTATDAGPGASPEPAATGDMNHTTGKSKKPSSSKKKKVQPANTTVASPGSVVEDKENVVPMNPPNPPTQANSKTEVKLGSNGPNHLGTAANFKVKKPGKKVKEPKRKDKKQEAAPPAPVPTIATAEKLEVLPSTEPTVSGATSPNIQIDKVSTKSGDSLPPPPPPLSSSLLGHVFPIRWTQTLPPSSITRSFLSDPSCIANYSSKTLPPTATLYKQPICVNDDHLFPDAVTPSKVKHCLPQGFYDVPFMDDEAFFTRKDWYLVDTKLEISLRNPLMARIDELSDSQADLLLGATPEKKSKKKISSKSSAPHRPLRFCGCVSDPEKRR